MRESSIRSKTALAVQFSRLKVFTKPDIKLEQYPTDSEVAGDVLWNLSMNGDLEEKIVADLGCGTGILGIGALMLGAKKVYFVDVDSNALSILKENLQSIFDPEEIEGMYEIIKKDVKVFETSEKIDIIIQNPPFGTKDEHADKAFLEKAFETAEVVVSFHKTSTVKFVEAISSDHNMEITHRWNYEFPLKQTQKFHKSKIRRIEVSVFRMEKNNNNNNNNNNNKEWS